MIRFCMSLYILILLTVSVAYAYNNKITHPELSKIAFLNTNKAEYNLVGERAGQFFPFYLQFHKTGDGTWRIVNFSTFGFHFKYHNYNKLWVSISRLFDLLSLYF
jgi:hypothetical protein